MLTELQPGTFAEELALLLQRYKEGTPIPGSKRQVRLRNHWAIPPAIYQVFQDYLNVTKERFASPLNYQPEMAEYWSCHTRDQLFGAHQQFVVDAERACDALPGGVTVDAMRESTAALLDSVSA